MQVTETLKDGLKRGYTITVTAAELDAKVNEKIAEAQPEVEMKGFRKGKVPIALLKKQYGPQMMSDVMQESIDEALREHFEASGDRPASQPDMQMANEDWKEGDDLTIKMSYEALPEVPQTDLSKIQVERLVVKPTDKAVDEALENVSKNASVFKDRAKTAKAKDGDQVVLDFVGKIDGEPFEGGAAEDHALVLGSGSFIPGFEEQLVGVKTGEEKTITVSFPDDYQAAHLAGKEATFDCTVKAVKKPAPAEIDDELAKRYGAEDVDGLREMVRERLEREYKNTSRMILKRKIMDVMDEMGEFELPPTLVDIEAKQVAHQLWHEENPDVQGHDHPEVEPTDEHIKLAERRVRLGLMLAEIGTRGEVAVSDAEMTQLIMNQARNYPGQEREFFEYIQKNQQMQQQIRAPIYEDKVVDYIIENAAITDREVTAEEFDEAYKSLDD